MLYNKYSLKLHTTKIIAIVLCLCFISLFQMLMICYGRYNNNYVSEHSNNVSAPTINCQRTPMVWDKKMQPNIYMGNNLWRYVGSAEFAEGTYIEIQGQILDENCVSVSNALVAIWQLDSKGYDSNYYDNISQSNLTLSIESAKNADKNFVGSGTAITNNLGQYKLYTIIPGTDSQHRLPHINFVIKHKDFDEFITQMYFPEDELGKDKFLMKYFKNQNERRLLTAQKCGINKQTIPGLDIVIYKFNIVLKGKSRYREY